MLTRSGLLELISRGENSGVEFKRDDISTQDLAKELVAFSNLEGGMVLLGVEDDGTVSGLTRSDLEEWVMNVCRDKIRPAIIPFFEVFPNIDGSLDIAVVRVLRGYDVHSLWHNSMNRYLVRVGSQSREASREELARMFQQRGSIRAELQPVTGAVLADLDVRRLRNYFEYVREQETPEDEDRTSWKSILVNSEFMVDGGVSVGGILLFGKAPNKFLPCAGISAAAYSGLEKDYDAKEITALRGPIVPLLSEEGDIVENGLVEQALEFVNRNTAVQVKTAGGRRVERPVFPRDALRESLVNAVVHRDYLLTSSDIELAVYSDRLEIASPGKLANGITLESMQFGSRSSRNVLLKDVMRDYRYLEHMGMGVPRKIIKGMREHNGTEPDFIEQHERFVVRLLS